MLKSLTARTIVKSTRYAMLHDDRESLGNIRSLVRELNSLAIILILARMMGGSGRSGGVSHVGYLAGFYFFYHFSGKLPENFWAVSAAGATVLGLESYHLWIYCSEEVARQREVLVFLDKESGGRA